MKSNNSTLNSQLLTLNPLEPIIKSIITQQGAISVAAFMTLVLQHPEYGYYTKGNPIGRTGDFITSPEISQLFGEIVGVWCVDAWKRLGEPERFALLELGAGSGIMMSDIIRVTQKVSGFTNGMNVFILESNQILRGKQKENISIQYSYLESLSEFLSDMPLIIVTNEFFDNMPIRQFEKTFHGWEERMVDVENDMLVFKLRPISSVEQNLIPVEMRDSVPGTVFEFSPVSQTIMKEASEIIVKNKGAMLVIDYGYKETIDCSTLQAISKHEGASILDNPGLVDVSAHVDFRALARVSESFGAKVQFLCIQKEFLENFGISLRADRLKLHVDEKQKHQIDIALNRLLSDDEMGSTFKVLSLAS